VSHPKHEHHETQPDVHHGIQAAIIPRENPHAQQPDAEDSLAASGGSVRESDPAPRDLHARSRGNYPFPPYHGIVRNKQGKVIKATETIPPRPVNYTLDKRKFTIEEVQKAADLHGYILNRARFGQLLRLLIPRMVAS
jgi:hypothetical protein